MMGPEIPASVGTHLEAGFRLPNKHEHLDDLSLNPAATNAPEAQLLNSLLLPPECNHTIRSAPPSSVRSASTSSPNRKRAMRPMCGRTRSTISYWTRVE